MRLDHSADALDSNHISESWDPKLFVWSAPDEDGVRRLSDRYREYLPTQPTEWSNIAHVLAAKRTPYAWKSFTVGRPGHVPTPSKPVKASSYQMTQLAFVFTGQGAQYRNMGSQLLNYPAFCRSLESCNQHLNRLGCSWSLFDALNCADDVDINAPEYSQPLTTCLQIALIDYLASLGVVPSLVVGHSSGEIAAAYASGILSQLSAVKVAYHRGRLSAQISNENNLGFTMMAVGLSREETVQYISRLESNQDPADIYVGCINSPISVTVSGRTQAIQELKQLVEADGIFCRKLRVTLPYHTRFMESISKEYVSALGDLELRSDSMSIPFISSVWGRIATAKEVNSTSYWVRNMTAPVEFEAACNTMFALVNGKDCSELPETSSGDFTGISCLLEVGPHGTLRGPIRQTQKQVNDRKELEYVACLDRGEDARVALLQALGHIHCAGYVVDLLKVNNIDNRHVPMPLEMPRYPFDHSKKYWIESSLSHNLRFRGAPRHDLLGSRSLDWNPSIAQWRNIMRLGELPWLEDHRIGSKIVLPAAGMISMAIEGLRQLLPDERDLLGIHLQDVTLAHAISFPAGGDSVQTQLTLSQPTNGASLSTWAQFRLFVLEDLGYIEACSGLIRAVLNPLDRDRVLRIGPWAESSNIREWVTNIGLSSGFAERDAYSMPPSCEIHYGPSFQVLNHVRIGPTGDVSAQVKADTWKAMASNSVSQSYLIHPTTLDGMAQPVLQALLTQRPSLPTMVPIHVRNIWIDCLVQRGDSVLIDLAARCRFSGYRGGRADVIASSLDPDRRLLVCLEGLETAFLDNTTPLEGELSSLSRRLCMKFLWKPDHETMTQDQILTYCTHNRPRQEADAVQRYEALVIVILCFVESTLKYVDEHLNTTYQWFLQDYIKWMRYQRTRLQSGDSLVAQAQVQRYLDDTQAHEELMQNIQASGIEGFFFVQIGRRVVQMLCGEVDPLDFIFNDGLADRYYDQMLGNDHHSYPASRYLDLLCFKNPSMNVLEFGAGTGGQTKRVLGSMNHNGVRAWAQYDYTDISPSFFTQARHRFENLGNINFKVFDVSKDPETQKFKPNYYDLIIASHVLHATDRVVDALKNIRKLLKPNGKLLLFETTRPDAIPVGFAFGLLKGWWSPLRCENRSPFSPCLTTKQWDSALKVAGFSGVDVDIPGQEELYCRDSSIIISTARTLPDNTPSPAGDVYVVVNDSQALPSLDLTRLREQLSEISHSSCHALPLSEIAQMDIADDSLAVFLTEVDSNFLDGISESDFRNLQAVLVSAKNTLWVTRSDPSREIEPGHHLADGLGRALIAEDSARKFVTLTLDPFERDESLTADIISQVAQRLLDYSVDDTEQSVVRSDGKYFICRLSENTSMDRVVAQSILPHRLQQRDIGGDTQLTLRLGKPGDIDSLQWLEEVGPNQQPVEEDELLVRVRAVGLTFRDYLIAKGQLNETNLCTECAGVVEEAGRSSSFQKGDRVCLISAHSTAQSMVRVKAPSAVAIPPHLSFVEACSLTSTISLSYQALMHMMPLQAEDIILVHQGASCDGDIPIQLAQKVGARVLVTATAGVQVTHLHDSFGLSDRDILRIDGVSLEEEVHRVTQGRGIDVIIGALSDDTDYIQCLAPLGRLIDITVVSSDKSSSPFIRERAPMNTSRTTVDMTLLLRDRPATAQRIFQRAMKFAFDENIRPPAPIHTFSAKEAKEAFYHFESSGAGEKRIIELDPGTTITAKVMATPRYDLPSNATYVIGGGLGGLGRSFARWLVSRGARHLILLSRSGPTSQAAKTLLIELRTQEVEVATPVVDIVNLESLKRCLQDLTRSMPAIRGCIQATVLLRDNLFPNLTHDDWSVATGSKSTASWNLHAALPSGMDFFVIISSINGIMGGRAQANYTAGNTFKDALAHYRVSIGEKAIAIDLGLMVAEGIVAENANLLANMRRLGHLMDISQKELLALLEYYCDPSLPLLSRDEAQILVGLETVSAVQDKKIDLHHAIHRPLFRRLFRIDHNPAPTDSDSKSANYAAILRQAASDEEAANLVVAWYQAKVAHILGMNKSDIDVSQPVHAYGMDSLVAIDLRNWFRREIGAEVQIFNLLGNKPLRTVARDAAEASGFRRVRE
ncbi:lovastatin nonaketide synthase [Xylariomycetidae sp. FL2044]|nr:lovastatin nonaketide synthase [Xylariomycetidae sp. FL2044]